MIRWEVEGHMAVFVHLILLTIPNVDYEKTCIFPTNLHSFVSFGKTHKLHNAIDHWLAGVTGQAHVALDIVTKEEENCLY